MTTPPVPAMLEQLTDRAPIVCFAKGLDGRYLYVNDFCAQLMGVERAALLGRTDAELLGEAVARDFAEVDRRVLQQRTTVEVLEHVKVPTTGEVRVSLTTKFPLVHHGEVFGVGALAFDVTERERALNALERSEERFRSVVEHSPAAYVAFDPASGRFVHVNERAVTLFGMTREVLLQNSPASVSPSHQPGGRSSEEQAREHIVLALAGQRQVFDWTHQTAQGEAVPCRIWLDGIEEGGRKLARAFIVDLRELLATRRELDRHQGLLAQAQALAKVGGWELELATGLLRGTGEASRLFTTGTPLADLLSRLSSASREQLEGAIARAALGGSVDLEVDLDVLKDPRTVRLVAEPVREGERVVGLSGWLQDVSTQRALELRLRQTSKMDAVGRLAGGVAHDFNNMLGAILSASATLLVELPGATREVREAIEIISKAGQQAASLTRQLLAFSRQEPARRQLVSLQDVMRDALQLLERTLDRRITLERIAPSGPVWVDADASSLKNVLINLGINARDAMPGGGTVRVELQHVMLDGGRARALDPHLSEGEWVALVVSDTGTGIGPELLPRVFEPFFTTKEVGKGTGLGLAMAYATMREHGGALTVESRVGTGTSFTLWLPPSRHVQPQDDRPEPKTEHRSGRVLLVDDEPLVRRSTHRFLTLLGFDVIDAVDGLDAEAQLRAHPDVSLVMLDLIMPGRSAEETLRALRALQPTLPVLFVSGYAPEDVSSRLLAFEKTGRLQKPWSERELNAAMAPLLQPKA